MRGKRRIMLKKLKMNEENLLLKGGAKDKSSEIEEVNFQEEKKSSMQEESVFTTLKNRQNLHKHLIEKEEDLTKPWYFIHI
jgi:hypothetical protein